MAKEYVDVVLDKIFKPQGDCFGGALSSQVSLGCGLCLVPDRGGAYLIEPSRSAFVPRGTFCMRSHPELFESPRQTTPENVI